MIEVHRREKNSPKRRPHLDAQSRSTPARNARGQVDQVVAFRGPAAGDRIPEPVAGILPKPRYRTEGHVVAEAGKQLTNLAPVRAAKCLLEPDRIGPEPLDPIPDPRSATLVGWRVVPEIETQHG